MIIMDALLDEGFVVERAGFGPTRWLAVLTWGPRTVDLGRQPVVGPWDTTFSLIGFKRIILYDPLLGSRESYYPFPYWV